MGAYEEFLEERSRLDGYLEQEYRIIGIQEDLQGAEVRLLSPEGKPVSIRLGSADSRKYIANRIIAERRTQDEQ
ncbi:hypothetical protein SY83_21825 [Paenibacillus swuensis]|uniref:Uncharacterized protein n=1 Tax=Paenibacillus swuensis TaxID=1178515 RepID=A0A172TP09_9BACL|nr:hypothetical protein [Paenibacillus swuensis]ANE48483.1 hypothetical protein SY83_21825 [Paenibacillus swuensis]